MGESKENNIEEEKDEKLNEKDIEGFSINFINKDPVKSMSDIRKKFLCKLTHEKIWLTPSEKPKAHQT